MKIYHNNNCSKSCNALDYLKNNSTEPIEIVEYLNTPPSKLELIEILKLLNAKPFDIIRTKEPLFIEKFTDKNYTDEQWIEVLIQNPILIERPIVVKGNKAVIARPIEKILEL
ncbi:MAG: arsenate reductase (glutaredoxin) [Bacteroidetes bacterium]|nr:arsenate reductase (glutaredoxin) [Bacteroidota bacterium]